MQNKTLEKVDEFFRTHPEATEVHEALGRLFTEKEKAEKFLIGVAGRVVITHTPKVIVFENTSDQLYAELLALIEDEGNKYLAYHDATDRDKVKALDAWDHAKKQVAIKKKQHEKQVAIETKDAEIAKANQQGPERILERPTREQLEANLPAEKLIVTNYEKLLDNPKLSAKKRNDVKEAIKRQAQKVKGMEDEIERLVAEEQEAKIKAEEEAKAKVTNAVTDVLLTAISSAESIDSDGQEPTDNEQTGSETPVVTE